MNTDRIINRAAIDKLCRVGQLTPLEVELIRRRFYEEWVWAEIADYLLEHGIRGRSRLAPDESTARHALNQIIRELAYIAEHGRKPPDRRGRKRNRLKGQFRGVWRTQDGYAAAIWRGGTRRYLGTFASEAEAKTAYRRAARDYVAARNA